MEPKEISKSVLKRLPLYLTHLKSMSADSPTYISATALANALGLGEVLVRKDLASVSDAGKPKVGYPKAKLIDDIEQFLGYDNTTDAVIIGAGKLGQALCDHNGFATYGLRILAAFDSAPVASTTESGKPIYPMDQLKNFCDTNKVRMGILTVPASQAQQTCNQLIDCGIRAVWNFAPVHLDVPDHILVQNEDMAASLAVLSMHLQAQQKEKKEK